MGVVAAGRGTVLDGSVPRFQLGLNACEALNKPLASSVVREENTHLVGVL